MSIARNAARDRDARWAALRVVAAALLLVGALFLAAQLARGQEPVPSPTPTMMAELTTPAAPSWLDTATTPIVNFLGRHPLAFLVIGLAVLVTNGLRVAWPTRAERPRLVAFLLGVLDPISGNFWALARWLAARVGFPVESPNTTDPPSGAGKLPDPNALKNSAGGGP